MNQNELKEKAIYLRKLDYWPFYESRKICEKHYPNTIKEIKTTDLEVMENKAWKFYICPYSSTG